MRKKIEMVKYFKLRKKWRRINRGTFLRVASAKGCLLEANWHLLFQVDAALLLDYSRNRYTNEVWSRLDQLFLKR